jgi:hypothetical protein
MAFRVPVVPQLLLPTSTFLSSYPLITSMSVDVVLSHHYSGYAMASSSRMLTFGQPGNRFWSNLTSEYDPNFYALTNPTIQVHYCNHLTNRIGTNRRVSRQNLDRTWHVLTGDNLLDLCHSVLVEAAIPLVGALSNTLQHLQCEAELGLWHGTALASHITPNYNRYLKRKAPRVLRFTQPPGTTLGGFGQVSPKPISATPFLRHYELPNRATTQNSKHSNLSSQLWRAAKLIIPNVSTLGCTRHCRFLTSVVEHEQAPTEEPKALVQDIPYSS